MRDEHGSWPCCARDKAIKRKMDCNATGAEPRASARDFTSSKNPIT